MGRKNLDLIIAILIVALNIGWMQIPGRPWLVSLVLALPLVLILPGYTLVQLLFRRRSAGQEAGQAPSLAKTSASSERWKLGHPIGGTDRLILSLGLSMALDILVGFILNILPVGLQPLSWTLSLGLLTALFALLALFVRRKSDTVGRRSLHLHITLLDLLFLGIAVFIIANAIWLAGIRPSGPQSSFTQFWILPANQSSKECAVSLGVQSFEISPLKYTIALTVNNQPVAGNWSTIVLNPQQKWVQTVPVTPEAQNDISVTAQLYRTDRPHTVYRTVHLTFHVSIGLRNGQLQQQCTLGG